MTTNTYRPSQREIRSRADAISAEAARRQLLEEHETQIRREQEFQLRAYQESLRLQAEAVERLSGLAPLYAARAEAGLGVVEAVRQFVAVEAQVGAAVSAALANLPDRALGEDQGLQRQRLAELRLQAGLPANHVEDGMPVPDDAGGITGLTCVRAILRRHLGPGWLVAGDTQLGLVSR